MWKTWNSTSVTCKSYDCRFDLMAWILNDLKLDLKLDLWLRGPETSLYLDNLKTLIMGNCLGLALKELIVDFKLETWLEHVLNMFRFDLADLQFKLLEDWLDGLDVIWTCSKDFRLKLNLFWMTSDITWMTFDLDAFRIDLTWMPGISSDLKLNLNYLVKGLTLMTSDLIDLKLDFN